MVTSLLFQPFALGGGEAVALMTGGVVSMLSFTAVDAWLPALSVAVPVITWFAPCVVTWTGAGHVAIPERESEQVKLTATGVLFHPAAFAWGEATAAIVGGVLSIFTVTDVDAVFPARSTAVPLIT